MAPRLRQSHLGGDQAQAAMWGTACSVWPLGLVRYAVPVGRQSFFDGRARRLRLNEGLQEALEQHREVLFDSQGYVAVPPGSEEHFEACLAAETARRRLISGRFERRRSVWCRSWWSPPRR